MEKSPEFSTATKILFKIVVVAIVGILILLCVLLFSSCASLPEFFKAADDIVTDEAVVIEVDRAAMKEDTDIHIQLDVQNKDQPKK